MKKKMLPLIGALLLFSSVSEESILLAESTANNKIVEYKSGDVNGDGEFSMLDVILFQKWLLAIPDATIVNWNAADFCEDSILDVFDLSMMKRVLVNEQKDDPGSDYPDVGEIFLGYYDANYSKPLPSARIALKCKASCPADIPFTVDVAMADGAFLPQDYEGKRVYEYSIYLSENYVQVEDDRLVVNGESGGFKKEYVGEEMRIFDISRHYEDYDAYHHEKAEIDFENYLPGSSGCITFSFKAVFLNEDGSRPQNPSTDGMNQRLYFYVGKNGTAFSGVSEESAEQEYLSLWDS